MPGTNLTRDEAQARAALVESHSYDVDVDLTTGALTVITADPAAELDDAAVRAAVAEAGYRIDDRSGAGAAGGGA